MTKTSTHCKNYSESVLLELSYLYIKDIYTVENGHYSTDLCYNDHFIPTYAYITTLNLEFLMCKPEIY